MCIYPVSNLSVVILFHFLHILLKFVSDVYSFFLCKYKEKTLILSLDLLELVLKEAMLAITPTCNFHLIVDVNYWQ